MFKCYHIYQTLVYLIFINFLRFLKGQYENIIIIMYHSIVIDAGEQCRSFHRC